MAEHHSQVNTNPALYSKGRGLNLGSEFFRGFLHSLQVYSGLVPQIRVPSSFHILSRSLFTNLKHIVWATDSVGKEINMLMILNISFQLRLSKNVHAIRQETCPFLL